MLPGFGHGGVAGSTGAPQNDGTRKRLEKCRPRVHHLPRDSAEDVKQGIQRISQEQSKSIWTLVGIMFRLGSWGSLIYHPQI